MRHSIICTMPIALLLVGCGQGDGTAPQTAAPNTTATATGAPAAVQGLDVFVGQHPQQSGLFDRSPIAAPLAQLLGDKMALLRANSAVAAPLMRADGVLYTSGNRAHAGGSDAFYLLIDPANGAMEVGLWQDGQLETLKTPNANITKPADVRTMIANMDG